MSLDVAGDPAESLKPEGQSRDSSWIALVTVSIFGFVLFLGILACLPNVGFNIKLYNTPSGAMSPTLNVGSHAVVSRALYGYSRFSFDFVSLPITGRFPAMTPQRGDVAVFKLPRDTSIDYIKRIVGLPGDKIQMREGRLFINGQMIERSPIGKIKMKNFDNKIVEVPAYQESLRAGESYSIIEIQGDTGFLDNTDVFEVPADQYFVMGDNRDNSTDSRMPPDKGGVGFVPLENFVGKVIFTY